MTARDATPALAAFLYHESNLPIAGHDTDTAGFTDHVFALICLLDFRFFPRIRDLADKRLYLHDDAKQFPILCNMMGSTINAKRIRAHWEVILKPAASIQPDTVSAS